MQRGYKGASLDINELSHLYDILYEQADTLFKVWNPCKFKDGQCIRNRMDFRSFAKVFPDIKPYLYRDGCCNGCQLPKGNGCTIKSLGCKLYYCAVFLSRYPYFDRQLRELCDFASKVFPHRPPCYDDKEKALQQNREMIRYDSKINSRLKRQGHRKV